MTNDTLIKIYSKDKKSLKQFKTFLKHLNKEWKSKEWGAPTIFLDIPTNTSYEVYPKPGRIVIMDQDCSHTVVAPNIEAGIKRPRYSLVWKLILHPKVEGQSMNLTDDSVSESKILFGSANREN